MEEEKAAALYEELTRKGGGAAKFKQGLGFSAASTTASPPRRGSALPSSSFMSSFVKASSPGTSKELDRQSQIEIVQNKLKISNNRGKSDRNDEVRVRDRVSDRDGEIRVRDRVSDRDGEIRVRDRRRSRSRSRERRRRSRSRSRERRRSRSRSRERRRSRSRSRERRRSRSRERRRSRSRERQSRERSRRRDRSSSRERRRDRREKRSRSRSRSPRGRKSERGRDDGRKGKEGSNVVDYVRLIPGYDNMTPAERVKAKMKLQLSQTAEKDEKMGVGSQWERFDFDKDAPIEDEVLEAADDDAAVSKRIGQSFRFASLEGKREDEVRNAHDEAMFGVPVPQPSQTSESENESENEERPTDDTDPVPAISFLNEKVLSKQQGSWRDRVRRNVG